MSEKEKPLPKPPTTPFGRKRRFEEKEEDVPLMADQMAAAMAEGRLEEFLQQELPDNEYARALARMMMGMTGMLSSEDIPSASTPISQPPEDVLKAAETGNMKGLIELLEREHKKRMSEASAPEEEQIDRSTDLTSIEKVTIEELMKIASENNLAIDWLVLRALRLYIDEYQKTGRL